MKKTLLYLLICASALAYPATVSVTNGSNTPLFVSIDPFAPEFHLVSGQTLHFASDLTGDTPFVFYCERLDGTNFASGDSYIYNESLGYYSSSVLHYHFTISQSGDAYFLKTAAYSPQISDLVRGSLLWPFAWQLVAIGCGMVVVPFTLAMALRAVRRGLASNLPLS